MSGQKLLLKISNEEMDAILNNKFLFKHYPNVGIEFCDPYYTPPITHHYTDDIDWEVEFENYNNSYLEEIKADDLRYPLILEMEAKKKELEENPIIFDQEEAYYETDPHKLVNFDEIFTPFFEKENNDTFFQNLKTPLRIKWEKIPEEDRKQKIVHFDQSIRKLKYDEIEHYFTKYLINKDIALLFLKYIPNIWPISSFLGPFEQYINCNTPMEMYDFFIERILLLGASYTLKEENEKFFLNKTEQEVKKYMKAVTLLKSKMFKDLLACIKVKPVKLLFRAQETPDEILKKSEFLTQENTLNTLVESNILTRFIKHYNLYVPHKKADVIRIYDYPEISKLIILLNLSFFNIFPITVDEYSNIRKLNKSLFIHFLWYLKDFFWDFYESPLKLKNNIRSYFVDDEEYNRYDKLITFYPSRLVEAKEYFYVNHNTILREVAVDYLEDFFLKEQAKEKVEYRHNADFYILNQELQAFEKTKEKIYAKFRKLGKSKEETLAAIDEAYQRHKRYQAYISKFLFRSLKPKSIKMEKYENLEIRNSIQFFIDANKNTIIRTYDELIEETTEMFIETLKAFKVYDKLCEEHKKEPKKYDKAGQDIYTKLLKAKKIEPNLWNCFNDYCYMAFDKYPEKTTSIIDLYIYQKHFIEEFMRDIMFFWGYGTIVPKEMKPILKTKKRLKNPI